ncbi:MAG: dephospho-CoA kinase [Cyanobium sp.]
MKGVATQGQALQQRRIGLTGGIASGKSTVGQLLSSHFGLPVLDADLYARQALAAGTDASAAVLARYGPALRAGADSAVAGEALPAAAPAIDRAALGRIVFADAAERQWLERLIHPLVRQRFSAELARLGEAPAVVLMIPLLFEAGLQELCSEVWLVSCDEATQRRRLMARDGLSAEAAGQRLAAQWPLERKRALADVVIANDGSRDDLRAEVRRALATRAV